MSKRTMLLGSALVLGALSVISAANAGDPYGGFGPSETDTQATGSNPSADAPTPGDQTMGPGQQPDQMGSDGNDGSAQGAADGDEGLDDESGH
jgi:hypothetical protein